MKIQLFLAFITTISLLSCSKDDPTPVNPGVASYLNVTVGSSRNYEFKNNTAPTSTNTYSVTSTNKDTTVNGRSYHVFSTSTGGSEYYAKSGNDYYTYQVLPAAISNTNVEILFLKDNASVGTTWLAGSSAISIPGFPGTLTININNTIAEKGLTKTVNAITYTDVIHVSSVISVPSLPIGITSDIHYYYAPKYGLIENSVVLTAPIALIAVDTDLRLMSANF